MVSVSTRSFEPNVSNDDLMLMPLPDQPRKPDSKIEEDHRSSPLEEEGEPDLSARTASLLQGNSAPLPSEVDHFQKLLAEGEAKLVQLAKQAKEIQADLHAWKQILSPMRRLPLELLSKIFFHVLEDHDSDDQAVMHSLSLICQVCSGWRALAFGTPRLWTSISFTTFPEKPVTDDFLTIVKDHLLRSAPHQFRLSYDTSDDVEDPPRNVAALLRILVPFLDRLLSLQLSLPEEALLAFSDFSDGPDALPALDSFRFFLPACINETHQNPDMPLAPILLRAPRLRDIAVFNEVERNLLPTWAMPWPQIVTLGLHEFFTTHESVYDALSHCSSLERCSLGPIHLGAMDHINSTSIHILPLLEYMDIAFDSEFDVVADEAGSFFRRLRMPVLTDLEVRIDCGWQIHEASFFITHLFSHSGRTLRSVSLSVVHFEIGDIVPFLQSLPVLEDLKCFSCLVGYDELYDALQYHGPDGPPPLVPRLETLRIAEITVGRPIIPRKIADMIVSRWWSDEDLAVVRPPITRWKNVDMDLGVRHDLEMVDAMQERISVCRDEGLVVSVVTQTIP